MQVILCFLLHGVQELLFLHPKYKKLIIYYNSRLLMLQEWKKLKQLKSLPNKLKINLTKNQKTTIQWRSSEKSSKLNLTATMNQTTWYEMKLNSFTKLNTSVLWYSSDWKTIYTSFKEVIQIFMFWIFYFLIMIYSLI